MSLPRPYDLENPHEMFRLYRELRGYMKVSLHDGTDRSGRQFALDGLEKLIGRSRQIAELKVKNLIEGVKLTGPAEYEANVVDEIERVLVGDLFKVQRERKIGPRSRIDLYVPDFNIGIEVKKGKPNAMAVVRQLRRYADSSDINSLILVSERGLHHHTSEENGKTVYYVSLASNWGLAV